MKFRDLPEKARFKFMSGQYYREFPNITFEKRENNAQALYIEKLLINIDPDTKVARVI